MCLYIYTPYTRHLILWKYVLLLCVCCIYVNRGILHVNVNIKHCICVCTYIRHFIYIYIYSFIRGLMYIFRIKLLGSAPTIFKMLLGECCAVPEIS